MNTGKIFEMDFRKSIPQEYWCYRLKDGGGWNRGSDTRFTSSNICDFLVADNTLLYLIELKTTSNKSIPKPKQLEILILQEKAIAQPIIVINFSLYGETYFMPASVCKQAMGKKKSINIEDCKKYGMLLPARKAIRRYTYDIKEMFSLFTKNYL